MSFENLGALLYMDGHGIYVWAAYGITLIVLAYNAWLPIQALKKIVESEVVDMAKGSFSPNSEDQS